MFFTIKNDFAIVRLRRKTKIISLIKKVRYAIYGIEAKTKGASTLLNAHISFDVRKNIGLYSSLVTREYLERMKVDWDTHEDIYYIKRTLERPSANKILEKCTAINFFKECGYPIDSDQLIKCNTSEEVAKVIFQK